MFNPDEFWTLAVSLMEQADPSEAQCRTAAGRAYYAFFLTVRERLRMSDISTGEVHGRVLSELRRRGRLNMAMALGSLRRLRDTADYSIAAVFTADMVRQAMQRWNGEYRQAQRL